MANSILMDHRPGDNLIIAPPEDLRLIFDSWPDNFGSLFEMGLRAFERLFSYRPALKKHFSSVDDDSWKKDDRIKRIVLSLEQTLVQAVGTYSDPETEAHNTPAAFCETLQELGGLHRAIVQHISPDNYELLFKLLPEVIADVVSAKRASGPFHGDERTRFLAVWTAICNLMSRNFVQGWERRVVPKAAKFTKAYSKRLGESGPPSASSPAPQPPQAVPNPVRASLPGFCNGAFAGDVRRANSTTDATARTSDRSNRSHSQDEVKQWQLERGYSAPLQVCEIEVALEMLSVQQQTNVPGPGPSQLNTIKEPQTQ